MAAKQQGASFVFGTDGGSWKFINIGRLSAPIPVIDDTDLSTVGDRTKIPGDLADNQMITLVLQGIPSASSIPTKGLVQTGTLNGTKATALGTPENWAGTGFVVDVRTPEFASDTEAIQTIEVDWMFDGRTGPARTAASV
jgi:hypothetical protein